MGARAFGGAHRVITTHARMCRNWFGGGMGPQQTGHSVMFLPGLGTYDRVRRRGALIEELLGSFVSEAEDADPQPPVVLPEAPLTAAPSLGLPLGNGRFVRAANRSDVTGVQWDRGKEAWKRARGSSRRMHTFYMCVYANAYTYIYICIK